jgi:hypothetical protein
VRRAWGDRGVSGERGAALDGGAEGLTDGPEVLVDADIRPARSSSVVVAASCVQADSTRARPRAARPVLRELIA